MPAKRPTRILLCAYPVGFGDCFLLTFEYADGGPRHVLIDFGTTARPARAPANVMARIAEDIRTRCGGKLHAVVATHRHADHVSGFATAPNGRGSGDVIATCRPDVVLQPWTEDPEAATDAVKPTRKAERMRGFVRGLAGMQAVSGLVQAEARALSRRAGRAVGRHLVEELDFLGGTNLTNRSAVENLMRMANRARAIYAYHGSNPGLRQVLPGVRTRVLGPPTLEQSDRIRTQREEDPGEFWHLLGLSGSAAGATPVALFPRAPRHRTIPPGARWLRRKLTAVRSQQLLQLVRTLDEELNNTSLILLFEVGPFRLLFPGDAQIENWEFTLKKARTSAALRKRLAGTDLYKVGHHGSLNATPKTLWGWFGKRSKRETDARLWSVLSTRSGKHGKATRNTEVPRQTLVEALNAESRSVTTESARFRAHDTGVAPHIIELDVATGTIRRVQ
jgi:hypothetical protein